MEPGGEVRRKMYECDVTYGTNSEFGFDFLQFPPIKTTDKPPCE